MKTLELANFPNFKQFVKAWMPGYKKKKVMVNAATEEKPFGWWWDGGSRSEYFIANIGSSGNTRWNPPPYPLTEADPIPVVNGQVVLTGGTFIGKAATLHITIHPDDLAKVGLRNEDVM